MLEAGRECGVAKHACLNNRKTDSCYTKRKVSLSDKLARILQKDGCMAYLLTDMADNNGFLNFVVEIKNQVR